MAALLTSSFVWWQNEQTIYQNLQPHLQRENHISGMDRSNEHGLRRPCHACSVHLVVWPPLSSRNRRFFSEIWLLAINMALLLLLNSHDTTQHFTKHAWPTWHINLGESYHLIQHLETIWASYQSTQSNNPVNGWVSRGGMRNLGELQCTWFLTVPTSL